FGLVSRNRSLQIGAVACTDGAGELGQPQVGINNHGFQQAIPSAQDSCDRGAFEHIRIVLSATEHAVLSFSQLQVQFPSRSAALGIHETLIPSGPKVRDPWSERDYPWKQWKAFRVALYAKLLQEIFQGYIIVGH